MQELINFNEHWIKLVNQAMDNYLQLNESQKVWFNIQSLIQAIEDGGLISYYYNSGANNLYDCLDALSILNKNTIIDLLKSINKLFRFDVPNDIDQRNDIINSWPDDGSIDSVLDPLDEIAMHELPNLEKDLVKYIIKNNLAN